MADDKSYNRTTFSQKLAVIDYVRANTARYQKERTSRADVCDEVNRQLKLSVGYAPFYQILKQGQCVWDWKQASRSDTRGARRWRRVGQLSKAITVIGKAVESLYKELNVQPPVEFALFLSGNLDFGESAELEAKTPIAVGHPHVPDYLPRSARGNVKPAG